MKNPTKKKIKKTPTKRKIRQKPTEQQVIDLFRNEIKKRARENKRVNIYEWVITQFHVKEIAKALHASLNDTVALCSYLHSKGVLRFAGSMHNPVHEWHWKLKEWTITSWDEEEQKPTHLA